MIRSSGRPVLRSSPAERSSVRKTGMNDLIAALGAELAELQALGRLRTRPVIDGPDDRVIALRGPGGRKVLINWASNDYLGLSQELTVINGARKALRGCGAGAGAARLLGGGLALHRRLEEGVARFFGTEDCLLTTTGFQANQAALVSLASDPEDVLIIDRLCHASTYDGARLAAGTLLRFRHNDIEDLERHLERTVGNRRRIVCVESIYSMDGDEAPLVAIAAACTRHGAILVVDEAHALGVVGPGGRGLCADLGVVPDVLVATCSKSLGSQGGLIAGAQPIVDICVNRGRSFLFSTAPVPAAVGAAEAALRRLRERPEMPDHLRTAAAGFRAALRAQGWQVPEGRSPIIPVIVGDEQRTLELAARLRELGHFAPPIRPPTVPEGSCRLRLTVTLAHRPKDLRQLVAAMAKLRPVT